MNIIGTCLLAAVLFATVEFQAEAQRRRVASGPNGSAEFDCPDEFGYYPHPTDCTQYYVCVFGGALLESCTGGLMYSHELQTCDWPRNVGCGENAAAAAPSQGVSTVRVTDSRTSTNNWRAGHSTPAARPIQHQQIQQQNQYEDVGEEEIIDRQQRVNRGQPNTVGQVARDRDGARLSVTNIIPLQANSGRSIGDKTYVAAQQYTRHRFARSAQSGDFPAWPLRPSTRQPPSHPFRNLDDFFSFSNTYLQNPAGTSLPRNSQQTPAPATQFKFAPNTSPFGPTASPPLPPCLVFSLRSTSTPSSRTSGRRRRLRRRAATSNSNSGPLCRTSSTCPASNPHRSRTLRSPTIASLPKSNRTSKYMTERRSHTANDARTGPPRRTPFSNTEEDVLLPETSHHSWKPTTIRKSYTRVCHLLAPAKSTPARVKQTFDFDDDSTRKAVSPIQLPLNPVSFTAATRVPASAPKQQPKQPSTPKTSLFDEFLQSTLRQHATEKPRSQATLKPVKPFEAIDYITRGPSTTENTISFAENTGRSRLPIEQYFTPTPESRATTPRSRVTQQRYKPSTQFLPSPEDLPDEVDEFLRPHINKISGGASPTTPRPFRLSTVTNRRPQNPVIKGNRSDPSPSVPVHHHHSTTTTCPAPTTTTTTTTTPAPTTTTTTTPRPRTRTRPAPSPTPSYTHAQTVRRRPVDNQDDTRQSSKRRPATSRTRGAKVIATKRPTQYAPTTQAPVQVAANNTYGYEDYAYDEYEQQYPTAVEQQQQQQQPQQPLYRGQYTVQTTAAAPAIQQEYRPSPSYAAEPAVAQPQYPANNYDYDAYQTDDEIAYQQPSPQPTPKQSSRGSSSSGKSSSSSRGRGSVKAASNRPTLKPSANIVSKAVDFIDIYRFPPSRPEPIYPTPRVDQTAAKCRKDVCLLPDCYCGGKDVPGGFAAEQIPQIVLLTFDDSVNDLNKGLYESLFERGRVNPNGCPIAATFYVSHEWTDYSQVQNLYADGHEMASHSISHSFGEQFSQKKWTREIAGQREILSAYGGVKLEDVRGMRAPFLAVGGNKMFKMLYDANFTYDSSMPVYENRPPSYPYTLDYKLFHDCMIPPCPTKSYPGVWEVPMVMWQDLNGGRCSMGDACSNPPTADGVYKMLIKNFERHYTTNRAPFGLYYHAAWFTQPHHKEGFEAFLDTIVAMDDVWLTTNWQAIQWMRDPTPLSSVKNFAPFGCNYQSRPKRCSNPKVCNLWHKSGVRYMRTCQPCPDAYPWTGKTGVRNSRVDNNEIDE
ncbi:Hypothetical predicted protein [Cloeon dipterum]|uniref:Chitin-binding type-2 domain-containing protein n=1 Tax=Cloeon dipterum TaxID=197152 RepID=A0A8S1DMM5_9INSE|nr:Hypothetical predicted protein [Cloeon dipterum]